MLMLMGTVVANYNDDNDDDGKVVATDDDDSSTAALTSLVSFNKVSSTQANYDFQQSYFSGNDDIK